MRRIIVVILIAFPFSASFGGPMRVHVIDVGQGASTLLEFDCGCALVDTGGEITSSLGFNSTRNLTAYLDAFFVARPDLHRTINVLYLSHAHTDHTRGAPTVWQKYSVLNLVTNDLTTNSQQNQVQTKAKASGAPGSTAIHVGFAGVHADQISANSGLTSGIIDPLDCGSVDPKFTVLWGSVDTKPASWTKEEFDNPNNHSVVLRVDYGSSSLLIPGDIEEEAIGEMVNRYSGHSLLDVDVIEAAHHGADNGTTTDLLAMETPMIAVISAGAPGREKPQTAWAYGHPHMNAIGRIQAMPSMLTRPAFQALVGTGKKKLVQTTITKAIYNVGWDGGLVLETAGDGHWIVVGHTTDDSTSGPVNINTASQAEIEGLPEIGPTRAKAIVDYRTANGPFGSLEDLDQVPGIGPTTLNALRYHVTF